MSETSSISIRVTILINIEKIHCSPEAENHSASKIEISSTWFLRSSKVLKSLKECSSEAAFALTPSFHFGEFKENVSTSHIGWSIEKNHF